MSLISNGLLMCVVCLGLVAGSMVLGDVLLDVTRDVGCDVLAIERGDKGQRKQRNVDMLFIRFQRLLVSVVLLLVAVCLIRIR